jgi:Multicopper oxidase
MLTRREFLNAAAVGAAGLAVPWNRSRAQAATPIDGSQLTKYVDARRIPGVLSPTSPRGSHYQVEMSQFGQQLHRDLPNPTTVWGYNGSYPGPTFEARKDKPITVEWVNNLPSTHLFTLDTTIEDSPPNYPDVRVSPHLHGGHVLSAFDGQPNGWFTSGSPPITGPAFPRTTRFEYRNDQQAATLWYHDHALGVTRLNVYAGLAGFYLIRDAVEDSLNLPLGRTGRNLGASPKGLRFCVRVPPLRSSLARCQGPDPADGVLTHRAGLCWAAMRQHWRLSRGGKYGHLSARRAGRWNPACAGLSRPRRDRRIRGPHDPSRGDTDRDGSLREGRGFRLPDRRRPQLRQGRYQKKLHRRNGVVQWPRRCRLHSASCHGECHGLLLALRRRSRCARTAGPGGRCVGLRCRELARPHAVMRSPSGTRSKTGSGESRKHKLVKSKWIVPAHRAEMARYPLP